MFKYLIYRNINFHISFIFDNFTSANNNQTTMNKHGTDKND